MKKHHLVLAAWIFIAAWAIWLRLPGLEDRPMHADEATGARLLSHQSEGRSPAFDPTHFHGPMLRVITLPVAIFHGERDWTQLTERTVRTSTVVAGLLLCFTPLLWRRELGHLGAWSSGALLTCSPLVVYYNRMYIHESWLALFGLITCALLYRCFRKPNYRIGIASGIGIGLMFATKETFAISLMSWAGAGLVCLMVYRPKLAVSPYVGPLVALSIATLLTATLFYTQAFRHPWGIVDAFVTFFVYETTPGHDKPITYYATLLLWPKHALGNWWFESAVVLLGILAFIPVIRGRHFPPLLIFLALATLFHFLIYSLISYKTPWLALLPWAHACLLAGCAFMRWPLQGRTLRVCLLLCLASTLLWQNRQSVLASGRFANDWRNPYAYVPTSRNITTLPHWLEALAEYGPLEPVAVVGHTYWPLPWYLRSSDKIGYWPEAAAEAAWVNFPLVFATADQAEHTDQLLQDSHVRLPRGLRHNVAITLYLRSDIWDNWQTSTASE